MSKATPFASPSRFISSALSMPGIIGAPGCPLRVSLDATMSYAVEPNVSVGIDGSVGYAKRYDTVSPSVGLFIAFNR